MSLSYVPLAPILLSDPITNVDSVKGYGVIQSGSQISLQTWTTNSISSSSFNFSTPPPSANIIVDRMVLLTVPIRLTFAGSIIASSGGFTPSSTLLVAGYDCPRAHTFLSALDTLQVQINGTGVSIQMADVIHALMHFNTPDTLKSKEYSMQATYSDTSSNYSDSPVGTARNPLGNYDNTTNGENPQRGASIFTVVSNAAVTPSTGGGTAASAIVDILVTTQIPLSPLYFGTLSGDSQGFYNVNSWNWTFNMLSGTPGGNRMWSSSNAPLATSGGASVTRTFSSIIPQYSNFTGSAFSYPGYTQPTLQFRYYTPNILTKSLIGPQIPLTYQYSKVERFPTDFSAIPYASGIVQIQSNNIQLPQIPRRVYIYVRPSNQALQGVNGNMLTDCYFGINNISIQWANASTLLSTSSAQQLYLTSVGNGIDLSWNQWSGLGMYNSAFPGTAGTAQFGGVGSILCLNFGTDIQLQPIETVGMGGQYQLQIQLGVFNPNSGTQWDALPLTLYLVPVYDGSFTIPQLGAALDQLAIVSKQDVLNAQNMPGVNYRQAMEYNGGDFLTGLRDFGKRIHDFVKGNKLISTYSGTVGDALNPFLPGASTVGRLIGNTAQSFGYGGEEGGVVIEGDGRRRKQQHHGGAHIGHQGRQRLMY